MHSPAASLPTTLKISTALLHAAAVASDPVDVRSPEHVLDVASIAVISR